MPLTGKAIDWKTVTALLKMTVIRVKIPIILTIVVVKFV